MKHTIIKLFFLFSAYSFSQENNTEYEKFKIHLPKEYEIHTIVRGKFDNDFLEDYLLILNNVIENDNEALIIKNTLTKRKVIILKGIGNEKFKKIYEDDNIVPPREYAGKSDFSYDKLEIKKEIFVFSAPRSELGQNYFSLMTYKLKFDGQKFKLIGFNEVYSGSPEEEDIIINLSSDEIIGEESNPFNIYKWNYKNLNNLKINKFNEKKINNFAYSLYKSKNYNYSISLLENVISKSPKRVVAYLNIADCYWETNEKEKAKENYKMYIQLMKDQKKDLKKIPKYVLERTKQ